MQRQGSFSQAEYAGKKKQTRRDKFLAEMETLRDKLFFVCQGAESCCYCLRMRFGGHSAVPPRILLRCPAVAPVVVDRSCSYGLIVPKNNLMNPKNRRNNLSTLHTWHIQPLRPLESNDC
jgi:hypothetical protein